MDKNSFLLYNDLVQHLYACRDMQGLLSDFLTPLRMLIPYSYASILLAKRHRDPSVAADAADLYEPDPYCIPEDFCDAERKYISRAADDPVLWLMHSSESTLICESDIMDDEARLSNDLYLYCYKPYRIYDTMQFSIVSDRELLGVLTLFRTRIDGTFTPDDMFFLRSIGSHLNRVFPQILQEQTQPAGYDISLLGQQFGLTARECEVLSLVFSFYNNEEIAEDMGISEYTIQKHIQNILKKTGTTSRLDLFRHFRG